MGASRMMGVEGCACGDGLTILAGILHILSNHEVSMSWSGSRGVSVVYRPPKPLEGGLIPPLHPTKMSLR